MKFQADQYSTNKYRPSPNKSDIQHHDSETNHSSHDTLDPAKFCGKAVRRCPPRNFGAKMRLNTQCQTNPHPPRLRQADNPPHQFTHQPALHSRQPTQAGRRARAPRGLSDGRRSSEPAAARTRGTSTRPRSRPPLETTGRRQWPARLQ